MRRLAAITWGALISLAAFAGQETGEVLATFHDGAARAEITRGLLEDYLAFKGLDPAAGDETQLAALASLLRLEAEARRAASTPRLRLETQVAAERLLAGDYRRRVLAEVEVDEVAVDRKLHELREQGKLRRPKKVLLSHLFKRAPISAGTEARRQMRLHVEALRQQLLDGADFAQMAQAESDSQTARSGGRLGIVRPGVLPKALEDVAFSLKAGELSQVLENDDGFVLLRCDKIIKAHDTPVAEARQRIRQDLERQAKETRLERLRQQALEAAKVRIDVEAARGENMEAVVLRFEGRRLTAEEVGWQVRLAPGAPALGNLDDRALHNVLESHAVQATLARWARQEPLEPELERLLRWSEREVLARAGLRRRVAADFESPGEKELRAYVAANPDRFTRREHYQLQVLRLDSDPSDPEEAGRSIIEIARQLRTGDLSFEEAAARHSDHWSAAKGGLVGWWGRKLLASHGPFVMQAVVDLEPGQTTEVIRQDRSWWILRLLERQPTRLMTFEEARDRADRLLGNEKLRALQAEIEAEVRRQVELEVPAPKKQTPKAKAASKNEAA